MLCDERCCTARLRTHRPCRPVACDRSARDTRKSSGRTLRQRERRTRNRPFCTGPQRTWCHVAKSTSQRMIGMTSNWPGSKPRVGSPTPIAKPVASSTSATNPQVEMKRGTSCDRYSITLSSGMATRYASAASRAAQNCCDRAKAPEALNHHGSMCQWRGTVGSIRSAIATSLRQLRAKLPRAL